jgi:hypothetical protein
VQKAVDGGHGVLFRLRTIGPCSGTAILLQAGREAADSLINMYEKMIEERVQSSLTVCKK